MCEVVLARINRRQITSDNHPQYAIHLVLTVFQELAPKTISRDKCIDITCVSCRLCTLKLYCMYGH